MGNLPPVEQCIISPYDLTARAGRKRLTTWLGYKVHLTETCEADFPHFITHVATTDATESDVTQVENIHQALAQHHRLPAEHIVDDGYMASTHLITSQAAYGIDLLGPMLPMSIGKRTPSKASTLPTSRSTGTPAP